MSKAIFILSNNPIKCADCALRCSTEGESPFCYATFQNVSDSEYYKEKPKWCPLQTLPEKKDMQFADDASEFYRQGYNKCLEDILAQK